MQLQRVIRGTIFAAAAAVLVSSGIAHAEPTIKYASFVEEISHKGDVRLRFEEFDKKSAGQADRSRFRFRLRLGTDFKLPNNFAVKLGLASGTGEQTSTNQSFDNLSAQKDIWIDKIYVQWAPISGVKFNGGRMDNPIWRIYSSDVVWDGDFNPEGFSQSWEGLVGPIGLFVNALQMVADEDSGNNQPGKESDQWMFGEQIGLEARLPFEKRLRLAIANYNWVNERVGTFGQATTGEGNTRSGTTLTNNFNVMEYTGELKGWMFSRPLSIQGTYVENTSARDFMTPATRGKEDTGFQVGAIFGKAAEKKSWEVAYFRKHVRSDATVADVADSDFGDGGTNRKGHIVWLSYAPLDFINMTVKYFDTKVINENLPPAKDNIQRLQVDTSWKF